MLSARAIAVQGVGFSARHLAVQGFWPGAAPLEDLVWWVTARCLRWRPVPDRITLKPASLCLAVRPAATGVTFTAASDTRFPARPKPFEFPPEDDP